MEKKGSSPLCQSLLVLLLLFVSFFTTFIYFRKNTEQRLQIEIEKCLRQEAEQQAAYNISVLDGQFRKLESLADYIGRNWSEKDEIFIDLSNSAIRHEEFWRMTLANIKGDSLTSDGIMGNVAHRDYFWKGLVNERVISVPFASDVEEGYICMMLAVPVKDQDGKVLGVLGGSYKAERFGELLMRNPGVEGACFTLMDERAEAVVSFHDGGYEREKKNILTDSSIVYLNEDTPEQVKKAMRKEEIYFYELQWGGYELYATQAPFGFNGWTMVIFTEKEVVDASYDYIQQNERMVNIIIVVLACICFSLLILIMMWDGRRTREEASRIEAERIRLARSEERYRLAARDSAAMVFEINLRERTVESNENFKNFFGTEGTYEGFEIGEYVFEEDMDRYQESVSRLLKAGGGTEVEIRMKKIDGTIKWCQMQLRLLENHYDTSIRVIGTLRDIDKEKREKKLLEVKAMTDIMTGLSNKAATQELIDKVLKNEPGNIHGLLLIDLDNLKKINDCFGHVQGDRAIVAIADAIRKTFRSIDIGGRVGGDEFIVFLVDVKSEEKLRELMNSFLRRISSYCVDKEEKQALTCSIGVVMTDGTETTFKSLYKRADTALYYVKRNGKGGFAIYHEAMYSGECSFW